MARMLNTDQINFAISKIIREAKERVCIITPYIGLQTWRVEWSSVMTALREAGERNIHVIIICRSFNDEIQDATVDFYRNSLIEQQKRQQEALDKIKEILPNSKKILHVHYCPYLHAKCFFNEKDTVISSMNLTVSSVANENMELGVLLKNGEDDELLQQLHLYINDICEKCCPEMHWVNSHGDFQKGKKAKDLRGHCIYCGRTISFNEENPVCASCKYEVDKGYKFPNRYCHLCGEPVTHREINQGYLFHYYCWKSLQ